MQPLLNNQGIAAGGELDLRFTAVRCSDVDAFAQWVESNTGQSAGQELSWRLPYASLYSNAGNEAIPQEDFMRSIVMPSAMALILAACSNDAETDSAATAAETDSVATVAETDSTATAAEIDSAPTVAGTDSVEAVSTTEDMSADTGLEAVINHERRDENRGRDEWRNPLETLSFFGIEPDMTIAEVLPGNGGWYSQILTPLTAERGRLIGVTYPDSLFRRISSNWDADAAERSGADITQMGRYLSVEGVESAQPIVGYAIDDIPDEENGQADAALFFRAMHHLFRFDEPIIDAALAENLRYAAPGGVAGVFSTVPRRRRSRVHQWQQRLPEAERCCRRVRTGGIRSGRSQRD